MKRRARLLARLAWTGMLWVRWSVPAAPDHSMAGIFIPNAIQKVMYVVAYTLSEC